MPHVRFDGLFRQEQPLADLAVHEPVCDELQHLDLACCRLLFELPEGRGGELDHGAASARAAPGCSRLETTAVVAVPAQDLLAFCSIHAVRIGLAPMPLEREGRSSE